MTETKIKSWVCHCKREAFDVYIGRMCRDFIAFPGGDGRYGNSFVIGKDGTREQVILKHKTKIENDPSLVALIKKELKGKRLGCWCHPQACHGDTLAAIANS